MILPIVNCPILRADTVFGTTRAASNLIAFSTSYFIFDIYICIRDFSVMGWSFLIHGVACFLVYFLCLQPYLQYYAVWFLLYEASTPFLNAKSVMERVGVTNKFLVNTNMLLFVSMFVTFRIVLGPYVSYHFWIDQWNQYGKASLWVMVYYCVANLTLTCLNFYWLSLMIRKALCKKVSKKDKST
jgi:TLC domain